ncbi:HAD family hydrolase [Rhizobium rhizogenes]|uniref:HAD family hydrolase n=1 Tax=Rhizobium rhizogenes TaxID=359 RepID=UPI001573BE8A|nr:HAD family phosphatase [Rhizobium rhizogenes]NTF72687.1 HAD family phosphatase [Rhizobium rhizogenes]
MLPKAVIFDMDGLLLDTERLNLTCYLAARDEFSLNKDSSAYLKCIGLSRNRSDEVIREGLADRVDFSLFMKRWREIIASQLSRHVPVKNGALRLIRHIAELGIPMGVATSTSTEVAKSLLTRAEIINFLGCVVGGDLVEQHKPNPEIYHRAAGALSVTSSDCIVFEDSEVGTMAALAAGALTVQVPDLVRPPESFLKCGQIVALDLLDGAKQVGLM